MAGVYPSLSKHLCNNGLLGDIRNQQGLPESSAIPMRIIELLSALHSKPKGAFTYVHRGMDQTAGKAYEISSSPVLCCTAVV